jgi:hypothetical protein
MGTQKSDENDKASQKSIADIREKIENLRVLLIYFRNAFNPDAFDSVIKMKEELNEKELLKEFKSKDAIARELIRRLAIAKANQEKSSFNFEQIKRFISNIEQQLNELMETTAERAKGGRKTNDLMFTFAILEIRHYQENHGGKYPSANYLSKTVGKEAKIIFEALKAKDAESAPPVARRLLLEEFQKRDEKLKKGTDYLPIETASSYLRRIKLEDTQNNL